MMEMSKKTAISKFFRKLPEESLPDIVRQVSQLTQADIDELAPLCAEALGATLKADGAA